MSVSNFRNFKSSSEIIANILQDNLLFLALYIAAFLSYPLNYLKTTFQKKIVVFFVFVFLILCTIFFALKKNNDRTLDSAQWVDHTNQIILKTEEIRAQAAEMQNALRGFLLTGDTSYLPVFNINAGVITQNINLLKSLMADNVIQLQRLNALEKLINDFIRYRSEIIDLHSLPFDKDKIKEILSSGKKTVDGSRELIIAFEKEENALLVKRKEQNTKYIQSTVGLITLFQILSGVLIFVIIIVIYNNVLARNKVERKLRDSNSYLHAVLENIPHMIFVKEAANLRFSGMNKAGLALLGISGEEIIGKSDYDFFTKEQADYFADIDREVLNKGKVLDIPEEILATKNGERWLHTQKIPILNGRGVPLFMVGISEDITERKMVTDKLKLVTDLVLDLYNNAPCGYHSLDAHGIVIEMNDTELAWLGYRREEVLGKLRIIDFRMDRNKILSEQFADFKKSGSINNLEYEMVRKDGSRFPVIINAVAVYDENGHYLRSNTTVLDFSARKKAEDQLKEFRHFFNNSNDLCLIATKEGYFETVNANMLKVLGYTEHDLKENSFKDFVHPEDIAETSAEFEQQKTINTIVKNFRHRFRKKDGSYIWIDWNSNPNAETGKIYAIGRDITERKMLEEKLLHFNEELEQTVKDRTAEIAANAKRFRALIENSIDAIIMLDASAHVIYSSPASERIGGYPLNGENKIRFNNIHPEDQVKLTGIFDELRESPGLPVPLQLRLIHRDGHIVWIEGTAANLIGDENVNAMVFNFRDITNRRKEEEKLQAATEDLRMSNIELERFAYIASHDLQEPLRMVSSFMNLLEKRMANGLDEKNLQYIHFAVDGAQRMKILIQDLLLYSRVGSSKEDFTDVSIEEVLKYAKHILNDDILKKEANIISGQLPVISANKTLITQLFVNLLTNALKYHDSKAILIEVGCTENKNDYTFYVKDNGIGIEKKFYEKIFVIFQRLHNRNEYSGTGIGLAICKKIIETHKGKIWLISEKDKGTTFYFSIPKNNK